MLGGGAWHMSDRLAKVLVIILAVLVVSVSGATAYVAFDSAAPPKPFRMCPLKERGRSNCRRASTGNKSMEWPLWMKRVGWCPPISANPMTAASK